MILSCSCTSYRQRVRSASRVQNMVQYCRDGGTYHLKPENNLHVGTLCNPDRPANTSRSCHTASSLNTVPSNGREVQKRHTEERAEVKAEKNRKNLNLTWSNFKEYILFNPLFGFDRRFLLPYQSIRAWDKNTCVSNSMYELEEPDATTW